MTAEIVASACFGGLAGWLAADAVGLLPQCPPTEALGPGELQRRADCRRKRLFALFEPLIRRLAPFFETQFPERVRKLDLDLDQFEGNVLTAPEHMALRFVQSVLVACGAALLAMIVMQWGAITALVAIAIGSVALWWMWLRRDGKRADSLRRRARARLPSALELMALMMESGGTDMMDSFETAAAENRDHPLGTQFMKLLRMVRRGEDTLRALTAWAQRTRDNDFIEVAFVLRTSLERGTSVEASLRALADQFQQRRLQRLERAAEEAKVHVTWPGLLVMLACLLIVVTPFILAARNTLSL